MTEERLIELVGAVVSLLTVTAALFALSGPCQLVAKTGVTAYFQDPFGTLLSTQEVAVDGAGARRRGWSARPGCRRRTA